MKRRSRFVVALVSLAFFGLAETLFANDNLTRLNLQSAKGAFTLQQLQGKVIYVDFWASWCGPCRKSFPWMNEMQQRYGKDGLQIVAINLDQDPQLAKQFLADLPANFTVAYDAAGISAKEFKVQGMPSSYLFDRSGKLHSSHIGFKEKDAGAIEAQIKSLLGK